VLSNRFGNFFNHVDDFANEAFLFVTSGGIPAASRNTGVEGVTEKEVSMNPIDAGLESEAEGEGGRNGEGDEG
jgi:tRNA pseudouridine38-40 synthase